MNTLRHKIFFREGTSGSNHTHPHLGFKALHCKCLLLDQWLQFVCQSIYVHGGSSGALSRSPTPSPTHPHSAIKVIGLTQSSGPRALFWNSEKNGLENDGHEVGSQTTERDIEPKKGGAGAPASRFSSAPCGVCPGSGVEESIPIHPSIHTCCFKQLCVVRDFPLELIPLWGFPYKLGAFCKVKQFHQGGGGLILLQSSMQQKVTKKTQQKFDYFAVCWEKSEYTLESSLGIFRSQYTSLNWENALHPAPKTQSKII